ncbi:uncharacterized protein LOC126092369 [Schistocerca cancellata]|uniref:uncharacterized protein LOC126092369 n=1 Tax=Schistocerca cancellata TaxID=274614 RepID=UPI002117C95B|nr:uncharacterized protein LOC126092369 [Schistocerca cancellata]
MPITTTYLKHMRSLGYSDEDALRIDVDCLDGAASEKTGDSVDEPITECNVTPDLVDEGDPAKEVLQARTSDSNSYSSTPEREAMESSENKAINDVDHARDELLALLRSVNQNYTKRDHLSSFGEYVSEKLRSLSSTHLQSVAQMRIQQVFFDLEMESQTQHLMSGLLTSPPYFSSPIARNTLFSADPCSAGTPSPCASRISTQRASCFPSESNSPQQQQIGHMFQPLSNASLYQLRK